MRAIINIDVCLSFEEMKQHLDTWKFRCHLPNEINEPVQGKIDGILEAMDESDKDNMASHPKIFFMDTSVTGSSVVGLIFDKSDGEPVSGIYHYAFRLVSENSIVNLTAACDRLIKAFRNGLQFNKSKSHLKCIDMYGKSGKTLDNKPEDMRVENISLREINGNRPFAKGELSQRPWFSALISSRSAQFVFFVSVVLVFSLPFLIHNLYENYPQLLIFEKDSAYTDVANSKVLHSLFYGKIIIDGYWIRFITGFLERIHSAMTLSFILGVITLLRAVTSKYEQEIIWSLITE